jgi:hypothetical protein
VHRLVDCDPGDVQERYSVHFGSLRDMHPVLREQYLIWMRYFQLHAVAKEYCERHEWMRSYKIADLLSHGILAVRP